MNRELLINAGIDYDGGVKRFVGRARLYEKALTKFSKDTTFSRIRAAYAAGDKDALLASAHEFKGMCGNIGLTALYEAADKIVQMLRAQGSLTDEIRLEVLSLDSLYQAVHGAVLASMEDAV